MNFIFVRILLIGFLLGLAFVIYLVFASKEKKRLKKEFAELDDCPFKFHIDEHYLVFDLKGIKLYGECGFGIRSDGTYGIDLLTLNGINGSSTEIYYRVGVTLDIGQSVFPIISSIEELEEWAKAKEFELCWDDCFAKNWKYILQKLDNLKYLEYKSKEEIK